MVLNLSLIRHPKSSSAYQERSNSIIFTDLNADAESPKTKFKGLMSQWHIPLHLFSLKRLLSLWHAAGRQRAVVYAVKNKQSALARPTNTVQVGSSGICSFFHTASVVFIDRYLLSKIVTLSDQIMYISKRTMLQVDIIQMGRYGLFTL